MRTTPYDYKKIYEIAYKTVKIEYKNKSEEWYKQKANDFMPQIIQNIFMSNIYDTLIENGLRRDEADVMTREIIEIIPKELYPNIEEWIDNKPLSDIKYYGVSIKDIMNQYMPNRIEPFINSIKAMMYFIKNGCKNARDCFGYYSVR